VRGERVSVRVPGGSLQVWLGGQGRVVLLVHGGPGMSCDYLDDLVTELGEEYRTAVYQQRGLAPSTVEGPFEIAREVADVVAILDCLGWERATVVGHSWGGHLAFHLAVAVPNRLAGVLAVDPLGVIDPEVDGDPSAELFARVPQADAVRAKWLDERAMSGEGSAEDLVEAFSLLWPAYFAEPTRAPPLPAVRMSVAANAGLWRSIMERMAELRTSLSAVTVPVGVVVGERSPFHPSGGALVAAGLIGESWSEVVAGAGHLPWVERPGSVRAALRRLVANPRLGE
jgi:pimeloyl-ACP methyl ester carboxylesterase